MNKNEEKTTKRKQANKGEKTIFSHDIKEFGYNTFRDKLVAAVDESRLLLLGKKVNIELDTFNVICSFESQNCYEETEVYKTRIMCSDKEDFGLVLGEIYAALDALALAQFEEEEEEKSKQQQGEK